MLIDRLLESAAISRLLGSLWSRLPEGARRGLIGLYPVPRFRAGTLCLVLDGEDRVLLLRHRFRGDRPWGLPGGWLEKGESPMRGMRRELREELGLDLDPADLELAWAAGRSGRSHIEVYFRTRVARVDPPPCPEFTDWDWFGVDDLPSGMHEDHRRIVRAIMRGGRPPA